MFHSDVLSEMDFVYSTKESEKKTTDLSSVMKNSPKINEENIWIMYLNYSLWAHLHCTAEDNAEYIWDFCK